MSRATNGPAPLLATWAAVACWLTLSSWSRLLDDSEGMVGQLLLTVALVALVGVGLRRLTLAWPFMLSGQLLTAMLTLQALLGSSWLPTTGSVEAAARAVVRAIDSAQANPAPLSTGVPSIVPLLLVAGVFLHVVVDLVAVSLRRVVPASLPLLAAWVVPVSILGTATPWPLLAVTAAAWLALLAADQASERAQWGRLVSAPWFDAAASGRTALVTGALAITVAIAVPAVLPHRGALTLPGGGIAGAGGVVRIDDPIADLRRDLVRGDDVSLLRITVPDGVARPEYVRLSVLDEFDGSRWKVGARSWPLDNNTLGQFPYTPALDLAGQSVQWRVDVSEAFRSLWLPLPRWPRTVVAGSDWRYDAEQLDVHRAGSRGTTAGMEYDVVEHRPTIDAEQLMSAPRDPARIERYAAVPDLPRTLRTLAAEVTAGARSDYERATKLQEFFQTRFRYSTERAPGSGTAALVAFLDERGRVGYCEQFAAAMALLARELGLPARVSVGFLRPEAVAGSTYEFSAHDLHAWPEIWFSGVGWVGFEPTPTSHTGSVPTWSRPPREPSATTSASPTTTPSTAPRPQRPDPDAGSADTASGTATWVVVGALGLMALAMGAAVAPRLVRARQRTRRLASTDVEEHWRELHATAVDLRVAWPAGRSPRTTARAVAVAFPPADQVEASAALGRLVTAVEEQRYADERSGSGRRDDVERCIAALQAGAGPRVVRRAAWWPRSLWTQ